MNEIKKRRKISQRQEKKGMEELGGEVIPCSGALPHSKSDGRVKGELRVEFKYTEADHYNLKIEDLIKIRNEATRKLERPVFQIEFKGTNKARYAIIPKDPTKSYKVADFFEIPIISTIHKSILLRSGDLYSLLGKSSPLLIITFERVPILGKVEYVIYEWNDFLKKEKENDGE